MSIISITTLLRLNQELKELSIPFKIHMQDACSKQTLWLEELETPLEDSQYTRLYAVLEQFFLRDRITLKYSADKRTFWLN